MTTSAAKSWLSDAVVVLKSAFHWWLDGLKYPLSEKLSSTLFQQKTEVPLFFSGKEITFKQSDIDHALITQEADNAFNSQETYSLEEAVTLLDKLQSIKSIEPVVCLSTSQVLCKQLTFPKVNAKELRSMLALELERITPLPLEEMAYDYVVGGNDDPHKLAITVYLVPSNVIAPLQSVISIQGEVRVSVCDDQHDILPIDLMDSPGKPKQPGYMLPVPAPYIGALAASLLLALYLPLIHYRSAADRLSETSNETRNAFFSLEAETKEQINQNNQAYYLSSKQAEYHSPRQVMLSLSDTLPDDTWLQSFTLQGDTLQIQGESPSASATLALIEEHPQLMEAEFYSPVSNTGNKEQFKILARIDVSP